MVARGVFSATTALLIVDLTRASRPSGRDKVKLGRLDEFIHAKGGDYPEIVEHVKDNSVADMDSMSLLNNKTTKTKRKQNSMSMLSVDYVLNPLQATIDELKATSVEGMVKSSMSDGSILYTYPAKEDIWVSDWVQRGFGWESGHVQSLCEEFKKQKGKADFLDVGANIGTWSVPLATCLNKLGLSGEVIAVEAMPSIADHLKASIVANRLQDTIHLFNYALTSSDETRDELYEHLDEKNKGGSSLVAPPFKDDSKLVKVKATTLDHILKQIQPKPRVFAMKMDVEGFEGHVLLGAQDLFQHDTAPCLIQIELKDDAIFPGRGDLKTFVLDFLNRKGYRVKANVGWDYTFHMISERCFKA